MNLRRMGAVARKECLHVRRDPRALAIGILLPMLLLLFFGYALTLDVDRVPLAVWDQSGTPQSRDLLSRFSGSRYFEVTLAAGGYRAIESALDRREALLALVIPSTFAADVEAGRGAALQILADGSDPNTASLAISYAESVVRGYSGATLVQRAHRSGMRPPPPPLDLRPRVWFNDDLESKFFIVPGLIAVIMTIIGALLTSLTLAREWETGTMEQLISTPVRPAELVFGKLVPYFAIGLLDLALSVAAGRFLFGVPIRGSLLVLLPISAVFLAVALGMGILISAVTKQQLLASQVAFVGTFLPAFLLSGFMTDTSNMPPFLQLVSRLVPARYFVTLLRGLYLKGAGPRILAPEGLLLVAFAAVVLTLAVRVMRKRVA